jgi:hypothetical protein
VIFDKRVASGIGAAMKAIDSADPGDLKKLTEKHVTAYGAGVKALSTAIEKELDAIQKEIDKEKELEKTEKDTYYRGMKVFKAKLNDYLAQAEARLAEMEAVQAKITGGDKDIKLFVPKLKAALTHVVAGIKKVKVAPSVDTYNEEICRPVQQLEIAVQEGAKIDSWDNKVWVSQWAEFRKQVSPFKAKVLFEKDIPENLKGLATVVKAISEHLNQV